MQETSASGNRTKKYLFLAAKILVTLVCLWYVSRKIDYAKAGDALQKANLVWLFLAFVLFILSKIIAAWRLNIYFNNIGINLNFRPQLKLYWLGMFYNLFLPGSISGDAFKVILLRRIFQITYKKTAAAVLLDRFSGVFGLAILLACYALFVFNETWIKFVVTAGVALSVILFYFLIRWKFKDFLSGFFSTLNLGIVVQSMQVACVYCLLASLHITSDTSSYIFLFLLSSIVSVLPLTVGGLGARELVFLEGSKYFGLLQETSVVISLLFYLITLLTSAFGAIYIFRDPLYPLTRSDSNEEIKKDS